MTLYLQHGHGKSSRISDALEDKSVNGVIFAARNERVENLDACISSLRADWDLELLFDPQFYICTMVPPNDRYLPDEYASFYQPGRTLKDFIGAKKIREYATSTIDFQAARGLDRLISPTVLFKSFSDQWSQIALQLADSSIDYHADLTDAPALLVSFVFSETALDSEDELGRFLDILTTWDVDGFYLIVAREDPGYSQAFDEARLQRLLYAVHVLGDRNDYEVVCGYSDFIGVPLRAAGASAFTTGWFHSLRQFHQRAFLKTRSFGRPSLPRYSSGPLLTSILKSELDSIEDAGYLEDVLSGVELDSELDSPDAWNLRISERHHWQTLAAFDERITGRPRTDVAAMIEAILNARGLFTTLQSEGVPFSSQSDGSHLQDWLRAMRSFQSHTGLK